MNKQKLEQDITDMKAKLSEMEKHLAEMNNKPKGHGDKPDEGDRYWYIDSASQSYDDVNWNHWQKDKIDNGRFSLGNVFHTEEAAKKHLRYRKAVQALWQCEGAREFVYEEFNWYFYYCCSTKKINFSYARYSQNLVEHPYFPTQKLAEAAIEKLGDQAWDLFMMEKQNEL